MASVTTTGSRASRAAAWSIIQKKNSSESITDALAISAQPQAHSRVSSVASTAVEAHT